MSDDIHEDEPESTEQDSGPFCRHWGDPADCDECKAVKQAIETIREDLPKMDPEMRLDTFSEVRKGYCQYCGFEDPDGRCMCQRYD